MTGYGKADCELDDKTISIEVKSLNSKQLDVYIRIPNLYREKELEMRNDLANRLKRGKIELIFSVEYREGKQATQINREIVKNYYTQLKAIADEIGINVNETLLPAIMRLPDAFNNEKYDVDPADWEKLKLVISSAVDQLETYRSQEGRALELDILSHLDLVESYLNQIGPFEKERTESFRNKLNNSLLEFLTEEIIDKNRYEQELIYYLEKMDIAEEKARLRHHCSYFREVIQEPEHVGRKLAFVAQEIGREINTIGSKANHSGIQKLVVLMKDELEKIKEQLMNVL
jgi:uncharacterized protein (TIGR00255 family)